MRAPILQERGLGTEFATETGIVMAIDYESLGIVGESGSSKSVTALSIMRLVPQSGWKAKLTSTPNSVRLDFRSRKRFCGGPSANLLNGFNVYSYLLPIFSAINGIRAITRSFVIGGIIGIALTVVASRSLLAAGWIGS